MLSQPDHVVRHFRNVLVWPVQIKPGFTGENVARIHERITGSGHWAPVDDEFTTAPADFQERQHCQAKWTALGRVFKKAKP